MNKMYYRGVHGVVLVCDLCDSDTFHDLETWLRDFLDHADRDNLQDVAFTLLGNKADAFRLRNPNGNNTGEDGTHGTESAFTRNQKETNSIPITEDDLAKWCQA
jgi:GTPase SAR1 family protein